MEKLSREDKLYVARMNLDTITQNLAVINANVSVEDIKNFVKRNLEIITKYTDEIMKN